MNSARPRRARAGFGLAEAVVALALTGIIGTAILRIFLSQVHFTDMQSKRFSARSVARSPLNLLMSEVRMVETGSGLVAATGTSLTLRIPIAMGVVCGASGGGTAVSFMPVDSLVLAQAAMSGHAWRDGSGAYVYTEGTTGMSSGGAATCTGASITTPTKGRTAIVTPALSASATAGTPMFIYQRVRYEFGTSSVIPGRVALRRVLEATNTSEEIAAPFDASSRFHFFRNDNDTADVAVPPLNEISGIQLDLVGASEKPRFGKSTPETASLRTAIFFVNRPN